MAGLSLVVLLTFLYHHGAPIFQYAVMSAIEFFGAFIAGRYLIRNLASFRFFLNAYILALLIILPFAFYENRTGHNLILDTLGKIARVNGYIPDLRGGGYRAQGIAAHPIHFGAMGALFFGCTYYMYRLGQGRLKRLGVLGATVFLAQSSAPLLATAVQIGIIAWGKITGNMWKTLLALSIAAYVLLSLLSNRGPIILVIETLTLNAQTAWWRVHVWNYGLENVWQHPILGLGLGDWERPEWLASTVDNFWLLVTMRHGIPAFLLLALATVIHLIRIIRAKGLDEEMAQARIGYLVSFIGYIFIFATVHAWGQMLVISMFFFGAGGFFYAGRPAERAPEDRPETPAGDPAPDPQAAAGPRYTRFPQGR